MAPVQVPELVNHQRTTQVWAAVIITIAGLAAMCLVILFAEGIEMGIMIGLIMNFCALGISHVSSSLKIERVATQTNGSLQLLLKLSGKEQFDEGVKQGIQQEHEQHRNYPQGPV